MATNTKTIGASGADYTTISAWEADLDDGTGAAINTTAYNSGDDAIGEIIDAAETASSITLNGGTTVGLNSVTLRPSSGNKHDGTFNSGCTITNSSANNATFTLSGTGTYIFEDLEFDYTYSGTFGLVGHIYAHNTFTGSLTVQRCLLDNNGTGHTGGGLCRGIYQSHTTAAGTYIIQNNILRGFDRQSTEGNGIYINYLASGATLYVDNNTCIDCYNGIDCGQAAGTRSARNNICFNSTNVDYANLANWDTDNNNYSSDATGNTQTTQTVGQLFEDDASGDYTPASGSDLVDAGADLTTTNGVNTDAAQYDRDSGGVTWDVGAIELQSAGGLAIPIIIAHQRFRN